MDISVDWQVEQEGGKEQGATQVYNYKDGGGILHPTAEWMSGPI